MLLNKKPYIPYYLNKEERLIMKLEINNKLCSYTFAKDMYLDRNKSYQLGMKVIYRPVVYVFDPYSFIVC